LRDDPEFTSCKLLYRAERRKEHAFEGYWRKVPSVERLVFKSVTECTTRAAMLKRGEVDIALAEPGLMLIDPWPWSAPLDDVRLKKN
jgi:ABC-type transport system substrate-binding protein